MGQYYKAIILAEKTDKKEFIRASIEPYTNGSGSKLTEHSYIDDIFMTAVEYVLCPLGMFYKSRIVWAGDYAENEPELNENLYNLSENKIYNPILPKNCNEIMNKYRYIVNHTKKQYVDKKNKILHPLALLTAEGNGAGGGDYFGTNEILIGSWGRDIISIDEEIPENYTELVCEFKE
jgi:hypothetical protein